ncbi:MAG: class I SAM-dependent methyltransferase [Pseudomonadota bacterium]
MLPDPVLATPPAPFDAQPWLDPEFAVPPDAEAVPTMLSEEEVQLLYWLTAAYATGAGAVCDLGSFAGGSTARMAAGMAKAGHIGLLHAYDNFTIQEKQKADYLYAAGIAPFEGRDMLHAVKQLLSPWKAFTRLHQGDIRQTNWTGGPIEILFIDAGKTPFTADVIAREFMPHLIPGRSVIVQQDYLHWRQPWIPVQMELLCPIVQPVAWCRRGSIVFQVTGEITPEVLKEAEVHGLGDAAMTAMLHRAIQRFPERRQRAQLARCIMGLQDHPGARRPQEMNGDAFNQDRIRKILAPYA